jgi:hypothetical protein
MRECHGWVVRDGRLRLLDSFPYASLLFSPINCMSTKRRRQLDQLRFDAIDVTKLAELRGRE